MRRGSALWWMVGLLLCAGLVGCRSDETQFDGKAAYKHVVEQCAIGPRPVGSDEAAQTAAYIMAHLESLGWATERQEFSYRGVRGQNVIAARGDGPLVLLGAHYDTRSLADRDPADPTQPVLGANDGASGVAVLLELARTLDADSVAQEVWLVFFDAEDQGGINGWPYAVGSSYMAQHLAVYPEAVVIVDMIGDEEQQIYWEGNSDPGLCRQLWAIAAELAYETQFIPAYKHALIDDHLPFTEQSIPAVDILDFDYPYWHTTEDTPDKVSPESLQRVGRVLETWLERGP